MICKLIITIFIFILIRICFDQNFILGKSNYDYILPLIINVSLGALFLINKIKTSIDIKKIKYNLNIYKIILLKLFSKLDCIKNFDFISKIFF